MSFDFDQLSVFGFQGTDSAFIYFNVRIADKENFLKSGSHLLSHIVSNIVPSAA